MNPTLSPYRHVLLIADMRRYGEMEEWSIPYIPIAPIRSLIYNIIENGNLRRNPPIYCGHIVSLAVAPRPAENARTSPPD